MQIQEICGFVPTVRVRQSGKENWWISGQFICTCIRWALSRIVSKPSSLVAAFPLGYNRCRCLKLTASIVWLAFYWNCTNHCMLFSSLGKLNSPHPYGRSSNQRSKLLIAFYFYFLVVTYYRLNVTIKTNEANKTQQETQKGVTDSPWVHKTTMTCITK